MFDKNSIFEKIECLNKIKKEIKENIELLYIFSDNQIKINVIFVTNEDEVYCYGSNANGVLGFGDETPVNEFTHNKVLSNKEIIDFKSSGWHSIGRSSDGKLYCWGNDRCLGLGNNEAINSKGINEISGPVLNKYLMNENIIDMCCGREHTLVLPLSKGMYAWGGNYEGQIGNNSDDNVVYEPIKVDELSEENVEKISCGWSHSMALTESGQLFSWGNNSRGQLALNNSNKNENKPQRIQIEDEVEIVKICCGKYHSLLLSREGDIYVFGSNEFGELGTGTVAEKQLTPTKLSHSEKFYEIASHPNHNISAALSDDGSYYVWGNCGEIGVISEPTKTKFKSFDEIFVHFLQITYKTLDFPDSRYRKEFKQLRHLGNGSFGNVYKVRHLKSQQEYAIKKIDFKVFVNKGKLNEFRKKCSNEIQLMGRLRSDYVVHYIRSWNENIYKFYIQMELCYEDLGEVLLQIRKEFNGKLVETMSLIEYFVYNEIFKETVEALNYLHKQSIIHRDLKPENILITNGINGRFVKLADFGLAVIHKYKNETHTENVGTIKYMAPEVEIRKNYDIKSDVYSLGLIAEDIFDLKTYLSKNISMDDHILAEKCEIVEKLLTEMTLDENNFQNRPNCQEILDRVKSWYINIDNLKNDSNFKNIIEPIEDPSIGHCFHKYFIRKKHLKRTNEEIMKLLISSKQTEAAKEVEQYDTTVFDIQVSTEVSIRVTQAKYEMRGSYCYYMTKKPRGKCIIINNLPKKVHMESKRFESIFEQLFFEVQLLNCLTSEQICDKLTDISKEESLQQHEAFIVMVISNSEEEKIFGYNAYKNQDLTDLIEIKEIVDIFSEIKCIALRRKPKLFFFTCCKSKSAEEPINKISPQFKSGIKIDEMDENRVLPQLKSIEQQWIEENKNTFICYSCSEGNKTFYNPFHGITHFGQALSHSIAQYACEDNLQSIMSRTCDFIDKYMKQPKRYAPELRGQCMRKQLYFNPLFHK